MTPEEEAVLRAILERDEKSRIQESLADRQGRRDQFQKGRMELLDKFMPMPADAPHVPPQGVVPPQGMPLPRLQDIINPNKIKSPAPLEPIVPIIGTRG